MWESEKAFYLFALGLIAICVAGVAMVVFLGPLLR